MFILGFKILLNYLLYMQVDMFELYLRKPILGHMRIENLSCGHYLGSYLAMYGIQLKLLIINNIIIKFILL